MTQLCLAMNQWQEDDAQRQHYTTSLVPLSQNDNYVLQSTPRNFFHPVQFSEQRNYTCDTGYALYDADMISPHNFAQIPYFNPAYRPFDSDVCLVSQSQNSHHLNRTCGQAASSYSQSSSNIVPSSFAFFETTPHISVSEQCCTSPQMDDVPLKYEDQLSLPLLSSQYRTPIHPLPLMPNQRSEIIGKSKSAIDSLMEVIQAQDSNSSGGARLSRMSNTKRLRNKTCRRQRGGPSRTITSSEHKHRSPTRQKSQKGEKINRCKWAGCDFVTNQYGNLQSHERVHSGLKPYKCDYPQCDKRFKQQGQVDAHRATHGGERFKCRLDDCGKGFTQRGNMKNHQERAHCRSIADYQEKFERKPYEELSSHEQDIYLYFQETYKYANKGIKGRGKGTKYVSQVDICRGFSRSSSSSPSSSSSSSPTSMSAMSSRMTSPCLSNASHNSRHFSVSSASSDLSQYMSNSGVPILIDGSSALSSQMFATTSYQYRLPSYEGDLLCPMLPTYQTD